MSTAMRDLSSLVIALDPKAFKARKISGFLPESSLQELARDATVLEAAQVEVTLQLDKERWYVSGQVSSKVEVKCSRCLDPFAMELVVPVDREYVVGPDVGRRMGEVEVIEELVYLEDGQFSVLRMAEEELIISLPMIPLCREDCAGLCPGCGAELNREPCRCEVKTDDSPFSILKGRVSGKQ
ncbi:MAG: DUF177 domain-containing protein [Magnetococcales bacterium]|nr:DUF177 domain-containing protein [Magnetococcales bacterium]NGZ29450.1 DUF177 domain-containing protein [Magnetococcales bacterium]